MDTAHFSSKIGGYGLAKVFIILLLWRGIRYNTIKVCTMPSRVTWKIVINRTQILLVFIAKKPKKWDNSM